MWKFSENDMSDSECGEQGTETVNEEVKKEGKRTKMKDDTEQPIYPCEECTECFTTQADLKVYSFRKYISMVTVQ